MESYFLVKFDHETKKFTIDGDTFEAHFEGTCYNDDWIYPEGEDLEIDDMAENLLMVAVENLNKEMKSE